jgi:TetR/AcrR family transcriptional regulator, transcriptional repressor of aconitase
MEVNMSPKVPKAYLEARRSEILEAAAKCFMEKGFHNTTMQDIYNSTNLSPGAVYNYFSSKEDIVSAAVEMSQERNNAMIAGAASGHPDQALSKVGQSFLTFAKQTDLNKAASVDFALYSEANRNPRIREALRIGQDAVITKLIELVKHNQHTGVFNDRLDAGAITRVLISIFIGIEIHKTLDPNFDIDSYAVVFEAIVKGNFSKSRRGHGRVIKSGSKQKLVDKAVS